MQILLRANTCNPCLPLRVKQIVINNGTYKYFEIKYSVANCLSE